MPKNQKSSLIVWNTVCDSERGRVCNTVTNWCVWWSSCTTLLYKSSSTHFYFHVGVTINWYTVGCCLLYGEQLSSLSVRWSLRDV